MKKKIFILILSLQTAAVEVTAQNWNQISDKIESCQKVVAEPSEKEIISFCKKYNKARKQHRVFRDLNVDTLNDTIFILEMHGESFEPLCSTLWTRKKLISYQCDQWNIGDFQKSVEPLFTKKMMRLSSQWDIETIKKEELLHSNTIPRSVIYLTRIVIRNKKSKVECLRFGDFYQLDD